MEPSVPAFRLRVYLRFAGVVTLAHLVTYIVAGTLAYFLIYKAQTDAGGLDPFMRDPKNPEEWRHVETWLFPAQILRGLLYGVALYPFLKTLAEWKFRNRFLALLGLLLVFSVWSVTMPGPGSIEGWLYLKPNSGPTLPNPLLGYVEVPGQRVQTLVAGNARVRFSPDGRTLAVDDGATLAIYDTASWEAVQPPIMKQRSAGPGPIAFSPDGSLIAILEHPRQVKLLHTEAHDGARYAEVASFLVPEQHAVESLAFSPDGSRLIAGDKSLGTIHIFDLLRIRERLSEMQLDWRGPALARSDDTDAKPLQVELQLGNVAPQPEQDHAYYRQQVDRYTRAIEANPKNVFAYRARADAYVHLDQADAAIADCTRAIELNPDYQAAWFWRGRAAMSKLDYESAARYLERSLELKPDDAWCCRHLAWVYCVGPETLRRPDRALELAERALELVSGRTTAYMHTFHETLGIAQYRLGRFAAALRTFDEMIDSQLINSPYASASFFKAMCHHQLEQPDEAHLSYDDGLDRAYRPPDARSGWDAEMDSIRREAAQLLGVSVGPEESR